MAEVTITRTTTTKQVNGKRSPGSELEVIEVRSRHGRDVTMVRDFVEACDLAGVTYGAVACKHGDAGELVGLTMRVERYLDQAEPAVES